MGQHAALVSITAWSDNVEESQRLNRPVWAVKTEDNQKLIRRVWAKYLHVYLVFLSYTDGVKNPYISGVAKMMSDATMPTRKWKKEGAWDEFPCFVVDWLLLECLPQEKRHADWAVPKSGVNLVLKEDRPGIVQYILEAQHRTRNREELLYMQRYIVPRDQSPLRKRKVHTPPSSK